MPTCPRCGTQSLDYHLHKRKRCDSNVPRPFVYNTALYDLLVADAFWDTTVLICSFPFQILKKSTNNDPEIDDGYLFNCVKDKVLFFEMATKKIVLELRFKIM